MEPPQVDKTRVSWWVTYMRIGDPRQQYAFLIWSTWFRSKWADIKWTIVITQSLSQHIYATTNACAFCVSELLAPARDQEVSLAPPSTLYGNRIMRCHLRNCNKKKTGKGEAASKWCSARTNRNHIRTYHQIWVRGTQSWTPSTIFPHTKVQWLISRFFRNRLSLLILHVNCAGLRIASCQ